MLVALNVYPWTVLQFIMTCIVAVCFIVTIKRGKMNQKHIFIMLVTVVNCIMTCFILVILHCEPERVSVVEFHQI